MGGESRYPIKIPSKQLINKFSTLQPLNINKLNTWCVTRITDAEGMFTITIMVDKNNKLTLGWRVQSKDVSNRSSCSWFKLCVTRVF